MVDEEEEGRILVHIGWVSPLADVEGVDLHRDCKEVQ